MAPRAAAAESVLGIIWAYRPWELTWVSLWELQQLCSSPLLSALLFWGPLWVARVSLRAWLRRCRHRKVVFRLPSFRRL